jgi:single-stranded DNA-binding protein
LKQKKINFIVRLLIINLKENIMAHISFIGFLGRDPESKKTKDNKDYLRLSIAESIGFGDNKKTVWYSANIWHEELQKIKGMIPYLKKGSSIFVQGILRGASNYISNKTGEAMSNMDIIISNINFLPTSNKRDEKDNSDADELEAMLDDQIKATATEEVPF